MEWVLPVHCICSSRESAWGLVETPNYVLLLHPHHKCKRGLMVIFGTSLPKDSGKALLLLEKLR